MKCKQCGTEVISIGNRIREFCSDKCRKAFSRSIRTDQSGQIQSGQSNPDKPLNYGQPDCQCMHCQQNKGKLIINHDKPKKYEDMRANEVNRVALPGDIDYAGCMVC